MIDCYDDPPTIEIPTARMATVCALLSLAWSAHGPLRDRLTLAAWLEWEGPERKKRPRRPEG